jgi:hypothetical protein
MTTAAGGHTHSNGDAAQRAIGLKNTCRAARPSPRFKNARQSGREGFERGVDHLFGGDGSAEALPFQ